MMGKKRNYVVERKMRGSNVYRIDTSFSTKKKAEEYVNFLKRRGSKARVRRR